MLADEKNNIRQNPSLINDEAKSLYSKEITTVRHYKVKDKKNISESLNFIFDNSSNSFIF